MRKGGVVPIHRLRLCTVFMFIVTLACLKRRFLYYQG